jgi:diguanylate cyclase (GGDEF)-like protein/PAS domain S-box-containing protein
MDTLHVIECIVAIVLLIAVLLIYRRSKRLHNELLHQRELLETLLNNIPDQIYFKNAESRFVKVNRSVASTLGIKDPEDAVGKSDADFFNADAAKAFRADDRSVMDSRKPLRDRVERGIVNGTETWMSTTKAPVFDRDGHPAGVVGISRDITERIRTQQQLNNVVAKARCILWNARVTRVNDNFSWYVKVFSSDQICKEFGIDITNEKHVLWHTQVTPDQLTKMHETSRAALTGGAGAYKQEFWIRADDGTPRWVKEDVQITTVSENEWDVVGVALDITERKRFEEQLGAANEKLELLARTDVLTGLLNRRTLMEFAEMEWARSKRFNSSFSVLIMDVDNFKQINDVYGHGTGDQALKCIAEHLKSSVRVVDGLGRYGGEEFVIVLPETAQDGALTVATKALHAVRNEPLRVDTHTLKVTISIGAATLSKNDRNFEDLLNRADQALLDAKRTGKNCIVSAPQQCAA